ncbi:response regulator transcription factor [Cohnella sp. LGH]|uniref:response regulator transcription factor n=1 Tax=unclassified Cohnella TaxID=2636738 RepID=UPI001ADAC60F|nr:response regulator transcription factor [Cohnella sp. LGH]QTH45477.1 response regulator transcription factor [Cohnella sp. LGH]
MDNTMNLSSQSPLILMVGFSEHLSRAVGYFSGMFGWNATTDCSRAKCMGKIKAGQYALVVMDASKIRNEAWELCGAIKRAAPKMPILVVASERGGVKERLSAFEAGADDCISKPFSCRELLYRMRGILGRTFSLEGRLNGARKRGDLLFDGLELGRNDPIMRIYRSSIRLSSCEYKLIKYLADRCNRIVSREELVQGVWPTDSIAYCRTVDTNIKRIREKLKQIHPELAGIIRTERGRGYCLMDPAAETG